MPSTGPTSGLPSGVNVMAPLDDADCEPVELLELPVIRSGGALVDVDHREALYDAMDER